MHPTRRLWAAIALAVLLGLLAISTAQPVLLAGSGLIGAWIIVQQYHFLQTVRTTAAQLEVQQAPVRSGIQTGESVPVTLAVSLDKPSPLSIAVNGGLPTVAVSDTDLEVILAPGETDASHTLECSWSVAGHHTFETPTVVVENNFFKQTLTIGSAPSVTAEPHGPRTIHVGEGGDRLATAYGEHDGGRHGSGIEPAELREYMPGDTMDQIDWKATARLSAPHVREYEAETERRTLLLVDHRSVLGTGNEDGTKLEYLREVALAIAASARRLGDPIGLLSVGDDGITTRIDPATTPATYNRIKRELLELEPTTPEGDTVETKSAVRADAKARAEPHQPGVQKTAADARQTLEKLTDGTVDEPTDFVSTLRPFYAARDGYQRRIESEPLYGAVKTAIQRTDTQRWTIICTDDSNPAELREAVTYARKSGNSVMVLLAPTVLYESGGLTDIERAYDRYVEFEELRRDLARMNRVTALEVGPKDRLASVLAARRPRGEVA
ncbi:DUF58 domain-containing protein [Natronolimnobius sp. AArcel1]|uniref:DUF58 domain-containing protein n=1 Tax=Natronolimnobius sp. AArcel1 TaxID=1679093 RepID=UPI0013ED50A8|nr:DUF58 domain-containing protein [Natronolimnobius sp. AArcel1]NGM70750.1 DUF58 domain-containing protein [Natronolimnobius sp. AArcel1]